MERLVPSFRRELRARAHALHPVVSIGHHGLTPSVLHEIDVALTAHELIKVRVFSDDRDERATLLVRISDALDCAPVQQIGKLLVLWRRRPVADQKPAVNVRGFAKRSRGGDAPSLGATRRRPVSVHGAAQRRRGEDAQALPVATRRRRRAAAVHVETPIGHARARKPEGKLPQKAITRVRAQGKAPAGVPRAAAPRRRRRAS
jgi:putative YhbY family RNA-binding protein